MSPMIAAPTTAEDLRDWLRELKEASGLSYAEIAKAIGEEERNVKRWMTVSKRPVLPRGDVVLRLLSALGVRMTPPAPGSVIAMNAQIGELRGLLATVDQLIEQAKAADEAANDAPSTADRLRSLEETVETAGAAMKEALDSLARDVRQLAQRPEAEVPRANRGEA